MMFFRYFCNSALAVLGTALVFGCAMETGLDNPGSEEESTESTAQPIGSKQCSTAAADYLNYDEDLWHQTPVTYNNPGCYKGYVVDDFADDNLTIEVRGLNDAGSKKDCEKHWMRVIDYERSGGKWVLLHSVDKYGQWNSSTNTCATYVHVPRNPHPNRAHRIAASARTSKSGPTIPMFMFGFTLG